MKHVGTNDVLAKLIRLLGGGKSSLKRTKAANDKGRRRGVGKIGCDRGGRDPDRESLFAT